MNENEYKPNSHKSREAQNKSTEDRKKIEKVVRGPVKSKKKNEFLKFADVFISEDAANVKSYILMDVLVPAIKKAISDVVRNGIDMILYGGAGGSKSGSSGSKVSYRSYYNSSNDRRPVEEPRTRSRFDFDDIIFDTRGDAEAVLTQMDEIIENYGVVSVLDLYDMADLTAPHTANKYGWTNIRSAAVIRVRDGYMLKLPKALPLN